MKRSAIVLFLLVVVAIVGFAEGNWTEEASKEAEVTIIDPKGIIGSVVGDKIIYNQKLLCTLEKGTYIKIGIPAGDNVFFIDNYSLEYFEDACLVEAEKGGKYFIVVSPVYGFTELKLTEEPKALELIAGLNQVELNGDYK